MTYNKDSNDVLIIGGGPSYWQRLDLARNFKGTIIAVEVIAPILIEEGIIPDIITTFEKHEGIELAYFPDFYKDYNFKVIHNFGVLDKHYPSLKKLTTRLELLGLEHEEFKSYKWERINNVGLFSCRYAREKLDAKRIYLIGFDHSGPNLKGDVDYTGITANNWVECFKIFMEDELDKCEIYNCSGQGNLFLPGIKDGRKLEKNL